MIEPNIQSQAPWWLNPAVGGAGVALGGIGTFLSLMEQKKAQREQKRQFEEQLQLQKEAQRFQRQQYDDAAGLRAANLTNTAMPALNAAQDWRERLLGMSG